MILYSTAIKNRRLRVVIDEIDGAAIGPGYMVIGTKGMVTQLAKIVLASPPFHDPADGVIELRGPRVDPDAAATGDAAEAAIYDGAGNVKVSGLTVGVGASSDIVISTVKVVEHQRLEVTSGRIRHG